MTSAVVIQDSVNVLTGARITTLEVVFHRYVLSEFNTHRKLSKNGASSRAIPLEKMIQYVRENMAIPNYWGKNRPGMKAIEEIESYHKNYAVSVWQMAAEDAIKHAMTLHKMGVHKQICNRLLEPFTMQKMLVTATSYDNFFWLRDHEDAQPEIDALAKAMKKAISESTPLELEEGMWHVPYVQRKIVDGVMKYYDDAGAQLTLNEALHISASCAAQTSYRKNDPTLEKAEDIFDKLINSVPVHASPTEHQATPIGRLGPLKEEYDYIETGVGPQNEFITSFKYNEEDDEIIFCSGNLTDWLQYRQIIPNNVYEKGA